MNPVQLLDELAGEIRGCPKCRLAETRTCAVPGEGSATARLMFVGEGPGEKEDLSGRPFVGASGQFLNSLLEQAGIERRDVFITNIVKCRPPQNRDPLPDEIEACNDYLMAQIAIIEPKFICTLGSPALKTLVAPHLSISKVHGQVFRKSGIFFIPLFHPAFALRRQELQATLKADILKLRDLIERDIGADEITDLAPRSKPVAECAPSVASETDSENLSLF